MKTDQIPTLAKPSKTRIKVEVAEVGGGGARVGNAAFITSVESNFHEEEAN